MGASRLGTFTVDQRSNPIAIGARELNVWALYAPIQAERARQSPRATEEPYRPMQIDKLGRSVGWSGAIAFIVAAVVVVSGCGASPTASPAGSAPSPSVQRKATPDASAVQRPDLQRALDELASATSSGAIAIVQSPQGTWRGASGNAGGGRPAAPGDRFGIASTTKTFTATVVLQLVGEGRLGLDDSVERWLPGRVLDGERVTIRQLLNHTSGIPDYTSLGPPDRQLPLQSEPGTKHSYSNTNYVILGLILEERTGESLDEVVRDRIFRPLGLRNSSYAWTPPEAAPDELPPWLGGEADVQSGSINGAGGIISTTADVARFVRALLGGELLRERELAEMLRTVDAGSDPLAQRGGGNPRAGLGIFGFTLACGSPWGHGGDMPTYSNQVLASRDGSEIVIVAQNTTGWSAANATALKMYCL
jgi:D-alanyl-D-alanine carboxypeptidase